MRRFRTYVIIASVSFLAGLLCGNWSQTGKSLDLDEFLSGASEKLDRLPRADLEAVLDRTRQLLEKLPEADLSKLPKLPDLRLPSGSPVETDDSSICPVLKIVDGDTLDVTYKGTTERIRMLCINTPERGRPGYAEATNALRKLVERGAVRLEFEKPGKEERGGYGRLLAYLFVDDLNVNVEMVRLGWSKHFTKYGRGKYAHLFGLAEQEAKADRRGVWAL